MPTIRLALLFIAFFNQNVFADVLILNDGTELRGTYAGGSRTRLRFEVNDKIRSIFIDDVKSLTFDREQTIDKPVLPSAKRPERPTVETPTLELTRTGQATITIAKDTPLMTHLIRSVSTATNKRNDRITVHLSKAITKGTRTFLSKDTQIHGRIARVQSITKGTAILELELTSVQIDNHIRTFISNRVTLKCDGELLTVTSGESAFDPEIALGDFITESGEIQLPENTPITFHLTSPLSLPDK